MKTRINIQRATALPDIPTDRTIKNWAKAALDKREQDTELTIRIVDMDEGTQLNRRWRKATGPTNVLSFPAEGVEDYAPGLLGDIVISVDTAKREAAEMGITLHERIYELLIHGLLHLIGYDHEKSKKDEKIMQKEEKRLLGLLMED